jgi:hypothetical protein
MIFSSCEYWLANKFVAVFDSHVYRDPTSRYNGIVCIVNRYKGGWVVDPQILNVRSLDLFTEEGYYEHGDIIVSIKFRSYM